MGFNSAFKGLNVTTTCPCSYHWALNADRLLQYILDGTIIDKFWVRNYSEVVSPS